MFRAASLIIVLALAAPYAAGAVCELTCAREHAAAAASAGSVSCHDTGTHAPEGPALAVGLDCHEIAASPALAVPVSKAAPPASVTSMLWAHPVVATDGPDGSAGAAVPQHGPPRFSPPLRI